MKGALDMICDSSQTSHLSGILGMSPNKNEEVGLVELRNKTELCGF